MKNTRMYIKFIFFGSALYSLNLSIYLFIYFHNELEILM
jgi:hypothetical protein